VRCFDRATLATVLDIKEPVTQAAHGDFAGLLSRDDPFPLGDRMPQRGGRVSIHYISAPKNLTRLSVTGCPLIIRECVMGRLR